MGFIKTVLLVLLPYSVFAANAPDWVKNFGKSARYPEQYYLTGFGMAGLDKDKDQAKCLHLATDHARGNLIEKIRVTIQSTTTVQVAEQGDTYDQYFSRATQSVATLEVQGLKILTHYDPKQKLGYALAYASREQLRNFYTMQVKRLREEIDSHLAAGNRYEKAGERAKALHEYLTCYPLFRELEEAQVVLSAIQSPSSQTFAELEQEVTLLAQNQVRLTQVREAIERLVQRPVTNPEDLAWYLVYCLQEQMDLQRKAVLVTPFTFQDTKMGSPFSRFFQQVLENQAVEVARWQVVQQTTDIQPGAGNVARGFATAFGAEYVLTGTYWEQEDAIQFLSILRQVSNGKVVASAETIVDATIFEDTRLSLKPQNFVQAFGDQRVFRQDEMIGGGLHLEVWTNKGNENLLFTEGETMRVFVRANMACYIRFIYHLADGTRVRLLDNHYIDASKVNRIYQIPEEFECAAPFGSEFLQVFARTEPFEPVPTVYMDGYDILKEDLQVFLKTTRGMKKKKKDVLQAEKRITVTTLAR